MILKEKSMMIVLSSPSGAGKTTLARKLQKNNPDDITKKNLKIAKWEKLEIKY